MPVVEEERRFGCWQEARPTGPPIRGTRPPWRPPSIIP